MQEPQVILVDENDQPIGVANKLEAHQNGQLHRAISVILVNDKGEWMIHQRNPAKYHSGGLWTNTCCSHPAPGEETLAAAERRLFEEMGIRTPLKHNFQFVYKAHFENGLTEYELDHVFFGTYNGEAFPDPDEVADWKWVNPAELQKDMFRFPEKYTVWFQLIVDKIQPIAGK